MRNGLIIGFILVAVITCPVLADDGSQGTSSGWIGIMNRISVNEPNNPISNVFGQFIPDWAKDTNQLPSGVYYVDTSTPSSEHSYWGPGAGWFQVQSLEFNHSVPLYIISQGIDDMTGGGNWVYNITLLDGTVHKGAIHKVDNEVLGIGSSEMDWQTEDGRWFNTSMSLPRVFAVGVGPYPLAWSIGYNLNTSQYAVLAFDDSRYMVLWYGSINNPPIVMKWEGPGQLKSRIFLCTAPALLSANVKMVRGPGADVLTTAQKIGTAIWGVVTTLWTLFDWLVLKAGFVFVLLILELGPMAYYMFTSKNIFQWFEKMIKVNKSMFLFFTTFFRNIMQIAVTLVLIFSAALSTAAGILVGLLGAII